MTAMLDCHEVAERGFIERYLAGKLTPEDEETFESHFLTCAQCQREIQLGLATRAGLRALGSLPRSARRPRRVWAVAASLAVAATVAIVVLPPGGIGRSDLDDLGQVSEPPGYTGVPVRGQESSADSLFHAAMSEYRERRYDLALSSLQASLAIGADSLPAAFFIGASLLLTDQPGEAAAAFRRVIALGESPYLSEAHYYRAKSLLRLGQVNDALDNLALAARRPDDISARASALADSIREALTRR